MSALTLSLLEHVVACLVPRRHYSAWSIRNGSRGPSEPSSETSPKCINREGLEQRRIRIIGNVVARLFVTQTFISVDEIPWSHQTTPLRTIYFWRFYKRKVDFLFCGRGGGGGATVKGLRLYYIYLQVSSYVPNSAFYIAADFAFYFYQFWNVSLLTNKNDYIIDHSRKYHNIP